MNEILGQKNLLDWKEYNTYCIVEFSNEKISMDLYRR